MSKQHHIAVHWFRRDLRLHDNSALLQALAASEWVLPCFIFDPRQLEKNDYKGNHALCFMAACLDELDQALREKGSQLYYFFGKPEAVFQQLIAELGIDVIYYNRDYTPFSLQRDEVVNSLGVNIVAADDALLQPPESVLKANHKPYTIYTPYYKSAARNAVAKPKRNSYSHYYNKAVSCTDLSVITQLLNLPNHHLCVKGGRDEAKRLLTSIKQFKDYETQRNYPALDATTHLSAHHKFGSLSIREVYHYIANIFGKQHGLIKELYWRDFFTQIAYHFPYVFGGAFYQSYDAIQWSQNKSHFTAWCEGRTGFPIVDAGMRELNETGYMHNRVRMIVASFLTKDLHIDWRWGEKYFAQQLTDYDPAVNNGNWQWAASTGCDAQPYFRIFNPWLQQKKFDPDAQYIKQWVKELRDVAVNDIHAAESVHIKGYVDPIVHHKAQAEKAKMIYKAVK